MAVSRKTQNKKNSERHPEKRKKQSGTAEEQSGIGTEVGLTLLLAACILIGLGNLQLCGRVGDYVSDVLFGLFGIMEYVFPFFLFFCMAFYLANRRSSQIVQKLAGLILSYLFLCAFLELLTRGFRATARVADYYRISSVLHTGGGAAGGVIVKLFGTAFGAIGAYVLVFAGLVISAIILTQRHLWRHMKRSAATARQKHLVEREALAQKRQHAAAKKKSEKYRKSKIEDAHTNSTPRQQTKNEDSTGDNEAQSQRNLDGGRDKIVDIDMSALKINGQPLSEKEKVSMQSHLSETATELSNPSENVASAGFRMPSFLHMPGSVPAAHDDEEKENENTPKNILQDEPGEKKAEDFPKEEKDAKKLKKQSPGEKAREIENIQLEIIDGDQKKESERKYQLPSLSLLTRGKDDKKDSRQFLMQTAEKLETTLRNFGVNVHVVNVSMGPTVTRYELAPEQGVKVSRIVSLQDDIKLNLAASEIRIEAPIPGKAAVGIEVPNQETSIVMLRDLLESPEFQNSRAKLAFAVGKDLGGRPVITDIEKMPHLLIAGATGSGKSVCINTLIVSLLVKYRPDEVKMLMIDPKVVELKIYDGVPHLLIPVVTDAKKAAGALNWAVQEMAKRYQEFSAYPGIRDIKSYNKMVEEMQKSGQEIKLPEKKMPRIVVIVDELADLMMVASSEVEDAICRLAQLARAAGIHLVIATQRPSVNVVTGLIKANMPSRIALAVTSGIDSRTILDMNGAEKLLGKGDMLFYPQGYPKPARVQGAFVSDEDINALVKFLTSQGTDEEYNKVVGEEIVNTIENSTVSSPDGSDERDEYFAEAGKLIIDKDKASIGMLQRAFKIGFNRAARIMDQLAEAGVVGPEEGTKPRKILLKKEEFDEVLKSMSS